VNVTIPAGMGPGVYKSKFLINATNSTCNPAEKCWKYVNVSAIVPEDWSWIVSPTIVSGLVYTGTSGYLGNITVTITGNMNITFNSSNLAGYNGTSLISVFPSTLLIENYSSNNFTVNYSIPLDQQPGIYIANVSISNSSANPTVNYVKIKLNVQDNIYPLIENLTLSKTSLEANYESLNISADVSDNVGISTVWVNIKSPYYDENVTMSLLSGNTYYVTYTPTRGGLHNVTVYVNDTSNNINSTQSNFTVIGTTTGLVKQTPQSTVAYELTMVSNHTFEINVTLNNTGSGTMRFVNLTINLPSPTGIYLNSSFETCPNLTAGTTCFRAFSVNVTRDATAGTTPQIIVNATWQNPDYSVGYTTNDTDITVLANSVLLLDRSEINNTISHGTSKIIGNFTIYPWGNTHLLDVYLNTSQGNMPESWISYVTSGSMPWDILKTSTKFIEVNISVPLGQDPGVYWTNMTANATGDFVTAGYNCTPSHECWDSLILNVTVLEDKSWNVTPQYMDIIVPVQTTGAFNLTLNNSGNVNRTWSVTYIWSYSSNPGNEPIIFYPSSVFVEKVSDTNVTFNYDATTTPGGVYTLKVTFTNTSADPQSIDSYINMTVTDTPPQINNPSVSPGTVDQNYESAIISATITDNIEIDMVWVNITKPDNTQEIIWHDLTGVNSYDLSDSYTPSQAGIYYVRIYANDTATNPNGINYTTLMNFTSIGTTNVEITSNVSSIMIYNITQDEGGSFVVNITINNTGTATAYWINRSFELPSGWSASPNIIDYGNLSEGNVRSNISTINIPAGTTPGSYSLSARVNWTNPENSFSTDTTSITVTVASNPVLDIVESSINMVVKQGSSNQTNFTLNSTGNDAVQNIVITCQSGNCSDLGITFSPSSILSLEPLNHSTINVSSAAPLGYPPGDYLLVLNASGNYTSDTTQLTITVPENKSWSRSPESFAPITVGLNSTGDIGIITINNHGNVPLTFNITTSGNGTSYITTNTSLLTVEKQSSGFVKVSYSSPSDITEAEEFYYVNISISNSTADPNYPLNTSALIRVIKLSTKIISPNQTNPVNVTAGDIVEIRSNVTYGAEILNENITFEVRFNDTECPLTNYEFNSSLQYWIINCTAPSIVDAAYYTLKVTANYTTYNALASDTEVNAIYYPDITPPQINVSAPSVEPFNNVTVEVNVTDNVEVSKVILEVSYPNTTKINYTMINISENTWRYNLTNLTDIGDYDLVIYSNDTVGNWNSTTGWFEVYLPVWFNGTLVEPDGTPISAEFNLYRVNTTQKLTNFSTNASGEYAHRLHKRKYDFIIKVYDNVITLRNVSITSDIVNSTLLDNIPTTLIGASGSRASKGMFIETVLNYTSAQLVLNYSGTSYVSETAIGAYKCSQWSYTTRACNSTWDRISSTVNVFAKTVTISSTSLSAYAVAEFICGNGVCESEYGESNAICPTDCEVTQPTTPTTGGAVAAGGGAVAVPTTKEEVLPPIMLSTNLLEISLRPGEYQIASIGITNNKKSEVEVELSVEGSIWPFVMFEKTTLSIQPKETAYARIKFYATPETTPGIYNGNIIVKSGETIQKISVILRVEYEREKLLDIKVDAITKEVNPGQAFRFKVTLYNLGLTKRVDVFINYTIKSIITDEIIAMSKETVAVETSMSFLRSILIPKGTEEGGYTIEATARYDNRTASSVTSFKVVKPFWLFVLLWQIFTNWVTYIILFVAIPSFYLGWKAYEKWKAEKRVRARYVRPVDIKKLPRKGIYIGKVAEANVKAYFDENKLTTHMIIAGGTGSGKTVAGMVIAEECLKKGIPVIVFDPTAQWTGFIRSCRDKAMLKLYPKFGMRPEEARSFKGRIIQVKDPFLKIEVEKLIKEGEITIFVLNKLTPDQLDYFVRKTIDYMFTIPWEESRKLKLLIVYDEVHRLLPKYARRRGATLEGGGYLAIERACREFRKWGIGLVMISQVLLDFRGAIRAVIATEAQMRTKYSGDINRIRTKYGWEYSSAIPKLEIGTGMIQNPEYNDGKPWFVQFRPLLHDTFRLTEKELQMYEDYSKEIEELQKKVEALKKRKIDTYDIELELKLAKDKVMIGQFRMAETYLESIRTRIKSLGKRGKK
jgi:uncharacterized membrane protein